MLLCISVSSVATPDGFGEIASTTPTEIPKQPTSHQISGKSTNAAASPSFSSSSSSKPFKPVDASRYSETSYAAKLLRPGPGGLRAPCQAGFAVPPASDPKPGVTVDERRGDRKQPQSYRNRPGRGKTLWISLIPAEMSDEKVSQAISDQLRGQSCEGHVVRIERIPNQQHGYIELDTEICAKLLREKGLHLQGRVVMLDFPNRNLNVRRTPPRNEDVSADVSRLQQQQRRLFSNRREAGPAHSNGHSANGNIVSSQNSQESEEGWTSATRRRPQQQQQGQQRYVNNRRRMSDSNINKNKNNNKTSLPQQMGRQFGHPPPQQKNTQT